MRTNGTYVGQIVLGLVLENLQCSALGSVGGNDRQAKFTEERANTFYRARARARIRMAYSFA
jgi:hypothetical protein